MLPASVNDMSGLNMCNCLTKRSASRSMCRVRSVMMSNDATTRHKNGAQRSRIGKCPRFAGVLMTTKVSKLANDAKLMAKVNVCASLLLPIPSRCWNVGPNDAARTAGQHQAPIMAGIDRAAMHPEPKIEANTSLLTILRTGLFPIMLLRPEDSSSKSQLPPCQALKGVEEL